MADVIAAAAPGGGYTMAAGTSPAAAHVSGAAALRSDRLREDAWRRRAGRLLETWAGTRFAVTLARAVTLPADPDAVRQILFNLLRNAVKFSPDGSWIELTVTADAAHAQVAVRDRGWGWGWSWPVSSPEPTTVSCWSRTRREVPGSWQLAAAGGGVLVPIAGRRRNPAREAAGRLHLGPDL
jgi:subtilisin family serine protease